MNSIFKEYGRVLYTDVYSFCPYLQSCSSSLGRIANIQQSEVLPLSKCSLLREKRLMHINPYGSSCFDEGTSFRLKSKKTPQE